MSNEQLIYSRSLRSIPLHEEREALVATGKRLEKEIANGLKAGKDEAWLKTKRERLDVVACKVLEVLDLMAKGRYSRNRAMGGDNGLGAKTEAWLEKCPKYKA